MDHLSKVYTVETEPVETKPGCWNYTRVKVMKNGEQVGEYTRNYSTAHDSFYPFICNGKELALYSKSYTSTRIMSLPDCQDIGGEEPQSNGFCPTGYYVPAFITYVGWIKDDGTPRHIELSEPSEEDTHDAIAGLQYRPFGFVCGCVWGDDTSRKIEYLDLSEADKGILKRDDRFGYIELPETMKLKDCILMEHYESGHPWLKIVTERHFNSKTGECSDR